MKKVIDKTSITFLKIILLALANFSLWGCGIENPHGMFNAYNGKNNKSPNHNVLGPKILDTDISNLVSSNPEQDPKQEEEFKAQKEENLNEHQGESKQQLKVRLFDAIRSFKVQLLNDYSVMDISKEERKKLKDYCKSTYADIGRAVYIYLSSMLELLGEKTYENLLEVYNIKEIICKYFAVEMKNDDNKFFLELLEEFEFTMHPALEKKSKQIEESQSTVLVKPSNTPFGLVKEIYKGRKEVHIFLQWMENQTNYELLAEHDKSRFREILNAKIVEYKGILRNNLFFRPDRTFPIDSLNSANLASILKVYTEKNLSIPKICSGEDDILEIIRSLIYKYYVEVEDDNWEVFINLLCKYEQHI